MKQILQSPFVVVLAQAHEMSYEAMLCLHHLQLHRGKKALLERNKWVKGSVDDSLLLLLFLMEQENKMEIAIKLGYSKQHCESLLLTLISMH